MMCYEGRFMIVVYANNAIVKENSLCDRTEDYIFLDNGKLNVESFLDSYELRDHKRFMLLHDFRYKLQFALISFRKDESKIKELENICKKYVKDFEGFYFGRDNRGLRVNALGNSEWLLEDFLRVKNVTLEDFLTKYKYMIVQNGCNNEFSTLLENEIINSDKIKLIFGVEDYKPGKTGF